MPANGAISVTPTATTTYTLTGPGPMAVSTMKTATVTVTPGQPGPNSPGVTASASGWIAPATIELTATASDSDGTIARVEFYAGGTKLGEDTLGPIQLDVERRRVPAATA